MEYCPVHVHRSGYRKSFLPTLLIPSVIFVLIIYLITGYLDQKYSLKTAQSFVSDSAVLGEGTENSK